MFTTTSVVPPDLGEFLAEILVDVVAQIMPLCSS